MAAFEQSIPLNQRQTFKILFAGDSNCGKTRIIQTYLNKNAPKSTIHDSVSTSYEYDLGTPNKSIFLVDVRGTRDIAKASTCFNLPNVGVFFYGIDDPLSLDNLHYKWIPRFRMCSSFCTPVILVGNKKDLRASEGLKLIAGNQPNRLTFYDGMKVKTSCAMDMFLECSAEDPESVSNLFQAIYSYLEFLN